MTRYFFAVRCGTLLAAVIASDGVAAAHLAMLQWIEQREGQFPDALAEPVTFVIPIGGRVPEDFFHLNTEDLLRTLNRNPIHPDVWQMREAGRRDRRSRNRPGSR